MRTNAYCFNLKVAMARNVNQAICTQAAIPDRTCYFQPTAVTAWFRCPVNGITSFCSDICSGVIIPSRPGSGFTESPGQEGSLVWCV